MAKKTAKFKKSKSRSQWRRLDGRKRNSLWPLAAAVVVALALGGLYTYLENRARENNPDTPLAESFGVPPMGITPDEAASVAALAEARAERRIYDVHEHIESLEMAPLYLEVMDKLGIRTMCLMGSSKFTLTMNESYGFTGYDENNEELIKIVEAYPGRFEAWPTLSPTDPQNLDKLKDLVARGATGVKLYNGHGYVSRDREFMFHPVAMDDPNMLPVYAYCEENYIPICMHVNPFDTGNPNGKPGFAQEFVAVLEQFPDLKVDAPHFILSSINDSRLRAFLDAFPNVYSNISFGDSFMGERLDYISRYREKFLDIFDRYRDRFMFASDLVLDEAGARVKKNPEWIEAQMQAYLDMLTKETYTTQFILDEETRQPKLLNGLALPPEIVRAVLYENYERFKTARPEGTEPEPFDWSRTGVKRIDREPGEAFPPRPGE